MEINRNNYSNIKKTSITSKWKTKESLSSDRYMNEGLISNAIYDFFSFYFIKRQLQVTIKLLKWCLKQVEALTPRLKFQ